MSIVTIIIDVKNFVRANGMMLFCSQQNKFAVMNYSRIKIFLSLFLGLHSIYGFSQSAGNQLNAYVDFLKAQKISAKDYVLELFDKYDIVVLCERYHAEMTQYDLIYDIISDKRFTLQGGHILMEVGVSNSYEKLNTFLQNDTLADNEIEANILDIIRNNDYSPLWEMTNYPTFIKKVHCLNKTLPEQQKITIHPVDVPFSWENIKSKKEYKALIDRVNTGPLRDEMMGTQMVKAISENIDKKFLIIMNHYHSWFIPEEYGAASWVKRSFPERTVNILINNLLHNNLTDNGQWDAAFKITNKENSGFDLKDTPFGNMLFEKYLVKWYDSEIDGILKTNDKMRDFYHGYIFYLPIEKHILSTGYPNYISGEFKKEINRRCKIAWGNAVAFWGKYKIRKYYNRVREKQYDNIEKQMKKRDKWINNYNKYKNEK